MRCNVPLALAPYSIVPFIMEKIYVVRLKLPSQLCQQVRAASVEINGNQLVFMDSKGKVAGMFLIELVEDWNEL